MPFKTHSQTHNRITTFENLNSSGENQMPSMSFSKLKETIAKNTILVCNRYTFLMIHFLCAENKTKNLNNFISLISVRKFFLCWNSSMHKNNNKKIHIEQLTCMFSVFCVFPSYSQALILGNFREEVTQCCEIHFFIISKIDLEHRRIAPKLLIAINNLFYLCPFDCIWNLNLMCRDDFKIIFK